MKQILTLLIVIILFSGCYTSYHGYSKCPTNDKKYFYKEMGAKYPKHRN